MAPIVVSPDLHDQFGAGPAPGRSFRLLVDAGAEHDVTLAPSTRYQDCAVVPLAAAETLEDTLDDGRCGPGADLLVACPGRFLTSPPAGTLGDRRMCVLPCGSTPVTREQLGYFLGVVERTDHRALETRAELFFDQLSTSETVRLVDGDRAAAATFGAWGDYEWNQQAGPLVPGDQQIAPSGELSAIPVDIMRYDPSRRLDLTGSIALHGAAIVHRGREPGAEAEQAQLYADLSGLAEAALMLDVEAGVVTAARPLEPGAKRAAETLEAVFTSDVNYRVVWELGIGLNSELVQQPGNCGLNEMFGGTNGTLHLGFGLTPATRFALTFTCAETVLLAADGTTVAGPAPRRRMNRQRTADCGCAEF